MSLRAEPPPAAVPGAAGDASLKRGALGFVSALVIGLASTPPAYSLAAVIGLIALEAGVQAPAIILLAFVPMLFIATAYYFMNRADQDPGTTFAWATRALGPTTGWLAGWAILTSGIIVIGLLANTAAVYTYVVVGWESAAGSKEAVIVLAVAMIAAMTWLCLVGIEISARTQVILISAQILALVLFAAVALVRIALGDGGPTSVSPAASWFSPFALDGSSALVAGLLIAVFCYWGWDSAVTVNEETQDAASAPGRAGLVATVILVGVYLVLTTACVAWLGAEELSAFEDETAFIAIAGQVFGAPWDKLVVLAVLTSALASTQTSVLPASRTALSMARHGAAPHAMARVHPRYLTPDRATLAVGGLAIGFYVVFNYLSTAFYESSLAALGLLICINYGLNGLACVVYYRREATRSPTNFAFMALAPFVGFLLFTGIFVKSAADFLAPGVEDATYWFGIQSPLVVTFGLFVLAAALIMVWRSGGRGRGFFARGFETFDGGRP